jgi:hypothetical protein
MRVVKVLKHPNEFPSIYSFTLVLFGNSGEIKVNTTVFEGQTAVQFAKHDIKQAEEPQLVARFQWYDEQLDTTITDEYYELDFEQETIFFNRRFGEVEGDNKLLMLFSCGDKKYWLLFNQTRDKVKFRFLTTDEMKRHIGEALHYKEKQVLYLKDL